MKVQRAVGRGHRGSSCRRRRDCRADRFRPQRRRLGIEWFECRLLLDAVAGAQAIEPFGTSPALFVENPAQDYKVAMMEFGPPEALNTNAASDSGGDGDPQVTTDGAGNWVAVWHSRDSLGGTIGTDRDVLVSRSADAGATWTDPVPLNTNAGSDSDDDDYEPQVTTDVTGNWVAVWTSWDSLGGTIGTDTDILFATFSEILSSVARRHVFYNHSSFDGSDPAANANDDDAIATDKEALLPGQTAAFENYTSYSRGINGVMVDIAGLPKGDTLDGGDFQFRVGNSDDPGTWTPMATQPTVTVRRGDGTGGSDRVTLIWPDGMIRKQWLQVTVLANADTGLTQGDVFYFGNAVGEVGNSTDDAKVNVVDMLAARDNQRNFLDPAPLDFHYDFDRNARVDIVDMLIARDNQAHFLNALHMISVPGAKIAEAKALPLRPSRLGGIEWLNDWDPRRAPEKPSRQGRLLPQDVDQLLTMHGS